MTQDVPERDDGVPAIPCAPNPDSDIGSEKVLSVKLSTQHNSYGIFQPSVQPASLTLSTLYHEPNLLTSTGHARHDKVHAELHSR
jgi:hypothetical protein